MIKTVQEITPLCKDEYLKVNDILRSIGKAYMEEHYPDWQDHNAYWD